MYIYVASPYTHLDSQVVQTRFEAVEKFNAGLLAAGIHAYSPIVHCHAMAQKYQLPTDADYWADFNAEMLEHAGSLVVLRLDGWAESRGVAFEINLALKLNKTVSYIDEVNQWSTKLVKNHHHPLKRKKPMSFKQTIEESKKQAPTFKHFQPMSVRFGLDWYLAEVDEGVQAGHQVIPVIMENEPLEIRLKFTQECVSAGLMVREMSSTNETVTVFIVEDRAV